MTVSIATVVFQVNYKKEKSWPELFRTTGWHLLLCLMAFLAGFNLTLTLILNFTIPFWLIFSTTSQFNQKAYFSALMTFVFLQLLPLDLTGEICQAISLCFCLGCFLIAVWLWRKLHVRDQSCPDGQKVMGLLAACLNQFRTDKLDAQLFHRMYEMQEKLYLEAHQKDGRKEITTTGGKLSYLFGLMCQRGIYFFSHFSNSKKDGPEKKMLSEVGAFFKKASEIPFWRAEFQESLMQEGEALRKKIMQQADAQRINGGTVCDTAIQYHLMYDQSLHYLEESEVPEKEFVRRLLDISLDMADIMDQLLYLVNVERRGEKARETLEHYVFYADYVLTQVQKLLNMKTENKLEGKIGIRLERSVEGDPELSALLTRYAKDVSLLFRTVCKYRSVGQI